MKFMTSFRSKRIFFVGLAAFLVLALALSLAIWRKTGFGST